MNLIKKAAMFVKLSQLDHIKFNFSKGAMFGLDARIALAIFGALSVISGAALYSAIQESKVVAIVTELNEVIKAAEQYILDVGEDLPVDSVRTYDIDMPLAFLNSTKAGWKGPYLSYTDPSSSIKFLNHNGYKFIGLQRLASSENAVTPCNATECTAGGNNCHYFAGISGIPFDIMMAIDKKYDDNNRYKGKYRVLTGCGVLLGDTYLSFQGPALLSQP